MTRRASERVFLPAHSLSRILGHVLCLGFAGWIFGFGWVAPSEAYADDAFDASVAFPQETVEVPTREVFTLDVGAGVLHRNFSYNDDLFARLRGFVLPAAPIVELSSTLRVWQAIDPDHVFSHLKLVFSGFTSVAVESEMAFSEAKFPTSAMGATLALAGDARFGRVEVEGQLGWRARSFQIENASATERKPNIPDVQVHGLLLALQGSLFITESLRWDLGFAWIVPEGVGEFSSNSYFPRADTGWLTLSTELEFQMSEMFGLSVYGEWDHFFYTLNPEPGDRVVAGGALDEWIRAGLRLTMRL